MTITIPASYLAVMLIVIGVATLINYRSRMNLASMRQKKETVQAERDRLALEVVALQDHNNRQELELDDAHRRIEQAEIDRARAVEMGHQALAEKTLEISRLQRDLTDSMGTCHSLIAQLATQGGSLLELGSKLTRAMTYARALERISFDDAALVGAAREAIPRLLSIVDRLRDEMKAISKKLANEKQISAMLAGLQEILDKLRTTLAGVIPHGV